MSLSRPGGSFNVYGKSKMSSAFACCKLKPPRRINVKHLHPQRSVHLVRASRVTKYFKKKSDNQHVLATRERGGGGRGEAIKTKKPYPFNFDQLAGFMVL